MDGGSELGRKSATRSFSDGDLEGLGPSSPLPQVRIDAVPVGRYDMNIQHGLIQIDVGDASGVRA